jgi:hypothetical protein
LLGRASSENPVVNGASRSCTHSRALLAAPPRRFASVGARGWTESSGPYLGGLGNNLWILRHDDDEMEDVAEILDLVKDEARVVG